MMRTIGRWALAAVFAFTGVMHVVMTEPLTRLIPPWVPAATAVVWITGVIEVGFAVALAAAPAGTWRRRVGWALAAFLVALFVGNVYQAVEGVDALGLDTDAERWGRLLFQPVLVAWTLWACGVFGRRDPDDP